MGVGLLSILSLNNCRLIRWGPLKRWNQVFSFSSLYRSRFCYNDLTLFIRNRGACFFDPPLENISTILWRNEVTTFPLACIFFRSRHFQRRRLLNPLTTKNIATILPPSVASILAEPLPPRFDFPPSLNSSFLPFHPSEKRRKIFQILPDPKYFCFLCRYTIDLGPHGPVVAQVLGAIASPGAIFIKPS